MSRESLLNVCARFDINLERGKGIYAYDDKGVEYIDFTTGIAANSLGHSHPSVVKAIQEQAEKLIHTSNLFYNVEYNKVAKKLVDNCDLDAVFLANTGTEANECAIKLARKRGTSQDPNKYEIIYMDNSFHGRTFGSLSATGQQKYRKYYAPLVPGFIEATFNSIEDVTAKMSANTCAVIIEPVQGEGGLMPANVEFLKAVQALCEKYDALLIFDEVQCGMGRIGSLFAYKHFGVIPDMVTLAKGLGSGICIGACLVGPRGINVYNPGDHGTTFGGNPLSSHVAYTVLTELIDNGVVENSKKMGKYIHAKLTELKDKYPHLITKIAGVGLLVGTALNEEKIDVKEFILRCIDKEKLLLVAAGGNIARCLPPLNVTKEEIDKVITKIDAVLATY